MSQTLRTAAQNLARQMASRRLVPPLKGPTTANPLVPPLPPASPVQAQPVSRAFNAGPSTTGQLFPAAQGLDKNVEQTLQGTSQQATNVLNVLQQLSGGLGQYGQLAGDLYQSGRAFQPQQVALNSNFAGQPELNRLLGNGIDFIGQQGIAQGQQNLALQEAARQRQLASTLGSNPGNQSLLNVLRAQGGLQMGLAAQPLTTQAQQGTLERGLAGINLQNQNVANQNLNTINAAGFNNQAQLQQLAARSAALQPYQNLIETLTNLQGQQRGVNTLDYGIGQKNYK